MLYNCSIFNLMHVGILSGWAENLDVDESRLTTSLDHSTTSTSSVEAEGKEALVIFWGESKAANCEL